MNDHESLIFAYILDGEGGGKQIKWDEINAWDPKDGILWVHLNYTSPKVHKWLKKEGGLTKLSAEALYAEETRPRTIIAQKGLLTFLRGVNLNPGEDPEDMVSVRVWLDANRIITTRRRKLLSITDLRNALDGGNGPKDTAEVLTMLIARLVNRMADVIDEVNDKIDALEEEVSTSDSRTLRPQLADLRREALLIRRYLAPQREALYRLQTEETAFLSKTNRSQLREANDRMIRYIEELDTIRDRATITQEELTSRIQEQMDKRMYILSVVAVIFMPLGFMTGLLGINVGGIPFAENTFGFEIICGILVVLFAGMFYFLRKKKWL